MSTGAFAPVEIPLIAGLRNLGLGLLAIGAGTTIGALTAGVSLFLVLVSTAVGEGAWTVGVAVAYSVTGALWLVLINWSRLKITPVAGSRRSYPVAAIGVAVTMVALVATLAAVGPARAAMALSGFMPSSGGTDWSNPEATGGVNDGDNEVKGGERPESVGFTDSDVYLETERSSLYDVSNDVYGEPVKRQKQDRMIALKPNEVTEQKETPAENLRASRQFAMTRQKPQRSGRKPTSRDANALAFLKGPTPAHLALMTYDRFDGEVWHDEAECHLHTGLEPESEGSAWFRLTILFSNLSSGRSLHQLKIGLLDSAAMPLPAHVQRFKVGSVNRADFFGWAQDGILTMKGRTIPAGTVIDAESRTIDAPKLRSLSFPTGPVYGAERHRDLPETHDPRITELARTWVKGLDRGWGQVEAIVGNLRGHCHHDHLAIAPKGCDDVVAHFLFHARRGPDYQFASAASLLLRNLGYPTRLVSGFYASPDRYDPLTRHTTIDAEDMHVWVQVQTPGGVWIDVEPTPGYALAVPPMAWSEWVASQATRGWTWLRRHAVETTSAVILVGLLVWFRRELSNVASTLIWRLGLAGPERICVLRTLRLVDRRSAWAGRERPRGRTPSRWYGEIAGRHEGQHEAALGRLAALSDWACYAPDRTRPGDLPSRTEVVRICREAVRGWTLGRFRATNCTENHR